MHEFAREAQLDQGRRYRLAGAETGAGLVAGRSQGVRRTQQHAQLPLAERRRVDRETSDERRGNDSVDDMSSAFRGYPHPHGGGIQHRGC